MGRKKSIAGHAVGLAREIVIRGVCLAAGIGVMVAVYTAPLWIRGSKK